MRPEEFMEVRQWAYDTHREWKQRSTTSDLIVQGKWTTLWPDLSATEEWPLVENLYLEALADKVSASSSITPFVEVAPTRGTKADRAERVAQKRRRAFITFMRDSTLEQKQTEFYYDYYQHGAMYQMPWKQWHLSERYPFAIRFDPRFAFPLSHNSNGELTSIFFSKHRRIADLIHEYGTDNEAVRFLVDKRAQSRSEDHMVEEIWFMDEKEWGVAVVAAFDEAQPNFRYIPPRTQLAGTQPGMAWLVPMQPHRLGGCPVVEGRRNTADGEYRGALDPMIPNLRVAQNIMARILDDLDQQIYAPKLIEGVENPEDFGPGALLLGTGEGRMRYEAARDPVNFEAIQHVQSQLESARNVGAFPRQRSGEFGASIASAKATTSVMGSYNVMQGQAQRDMALFLRRGLSRMAEFDEQWCGGGNKDITGWDEGEIYSDSYDPGTFWKGDYRCEVGYHAIGVDEQQQLTRLGLAKNMGGLSRRAFMRKSGLVQNPLAEEREIALETVTDAFQAFIFQQADAGNIDPLLKFVERVDGDDSTARAAAMETIKEMMGAVPGGESAVPQPSNNPAEALVANRSLEQGGIPGNAAGLPPSVSPALAELLPGGSGP